MNAEGRHPSATDSRHVRSVYSIDAASLAARLPEREAWKALQQLADRAGGPRARPSAETGLGLAAVIPEGLRRLLRR